MARDPVFILGNTRSGTTILYRTLQLQGAFALGPGRRGGEGDVDPTESMILWHPQALFDLEAEEVHLQRQFLLFDEAAIARFVSEAEKVPRWRRRLVSFTRWLERRDGGEAARAWAWGASGARPLLRAYLEAARLARGVERLVEKSPIHQRCLPELRSSYPDAPLLFSIRHPVFTYRSIVKRRRKREELGLRVHPKGSLAESPEAFIARYRATVARALKERRARPGGIHFVRYEDLTSEPEKTLLGIGDFLGEDFAPASLPRSAADGWESEEDPLVVGPIVPGANDWSDWLPESTARQIDAALAEERAEFGYESGV